MNRAEAIRRVLDYIDQIEGEWGSGKCDTTEEAFEVVSALGVTREEFDRAILKAG